MKLLLRLQILSMLTGNNQILLDGVIFTMFRTVNERLVAEPGLMSRLGQVTEGAVVRVEAHQRMGDMVVTVMELGEGTLMDVINK